jgi:hypothetical protein
MRIVLFHRCDDKMFGTVHTPIISFLAHVLILSYPLVLGMIESIACAIFLINIL